MSDFLVFYQTRKPQVYRGMPENILSPGVCALEVYAEPSAEHTGHRHHVRMSDNGFLVTECETCDKVTNVKPEGEYAEMLEKARDWQENHDFTYGMKRGRE